MTKADLKTGMVVTCRNGREYMVIQTATVVGRSSTLITKEGILARIGEVGFNEMSSFTDDLCDRYGDSNWDIVKVEAYKSFGELLNKDVGCLQTIWTRFEKKKYTYSQLKEILGEEFEIVKD